MSRSTGLRMSNRGNRGGITIETVEILPSTLPFYILLRKSLRQQRSGCIHVATGVVLRVVFSGLGGGSGCTERLSKWGESRAESEKKQVSSGEKLSSTSQTRPGLQPGAAASSQTSGSGSTVPSESQTVFHLGCRRRPQKLQRGASKL